MIHFEVKIFQNILNERPYHLDSSLMVASILYHQEEYQQSRILTGSLFIYLFIDFFILLKNFFRISSMLIVFLKLFLFIY